jgi:hypothetical protein
MAGEICPVRQDGNQSERNLSRPRSCGETSPLTDPCKFDILLSGHSDSSVLSIGGQMEAKIARCTIAAGRYLTEGGARQG